MKSFLKFLASLCALLLVISLPLALLAFDIGHAVFNPPLVKRVLTEQVTQSNLLPAALEWFSSRGARQRVDSGEVQSGETQPDIVQLISFLDQNDWAKIKDEVLPNEILANWVSVSVDGTYAWIDSQERVPQITWDMQAFKERVSSEHGANSIVIAYSKLPPCTTAQIKDFQARQAAVPVETKVPYNLCNFPPPWHEDQFSQYLASLQDVADNIPPRFELTNELSYTADTQGSGPQAIKAQLRLIRLLMGIAWLVPLVFLLLILAFAVRSLADLGRWWGLPLLVGGFVALLPALAYRPLITGFLAAGPLSEAPELVKNEAIRSLLRFTSEAFLPLLIQAIIIIVVALVMIFVVPRLGLQGEGSPAEG